MKELEQIDPKIIKNFLHIPTRNVTIVPPEIDRQQWHRAIAEVQDLQSLLKLVLGKYICLNLPDLMIAGYTTGISGSNYVIKAVIKNIGTLVSTQCRAYFEANSSTHPPDENEIRIQNVQPIVPINPNAVQEIDKSLNITDLLNQRVDSFTLRVNPKGECKECNYNNNTETWSFL